MPREPARREGWTCPRCRRSFVQRRARHSCDVRTAASFFAGYPRARKLFGALRPLLAEVGEPGPEVTKSQIAFRAGRTRFAWAWLPQRWIASAPPEALVVSFTLDRRLRSRRVKEAVQVRPGRWTHHVVVEDEAQLDAQLGRWLRAAYVLASSAPKRAVL